MKAMILAAGFGTRMRPLTLQVPKPMIPVLNRPMLEHTLDLLRGQNITDLTINLHHMPDAVTDHFGDGARFGARIHWSKEDAILGTAGGIKAAQRHLAGSAFVVMNSDVLADIDLKQVLAFHREQGSVLTLALKEGDSPESCDPIEIQYGEASVSVVFGEVSGVAGDLTGDGAVDAQDLLILLAAFGDCDVACCPADLDGDGIVGVTDLLDLLANWS